MKGNDAPSSAPRPSDPLGKQPLKILHVINSLGLGGAETLLYRLVTRESPNSHIVVSLGAPAWYSGPLNDAGVPLHHLGMESVTSAPGALARLNRIIRDSGADVVQCWMYRSNLLGGQLAQLAGIPVIWGIHCSSLEPLKLTSRLLVYLSGLVARWNPDFIINCSARSAQLHERLGFSAAAGGVVHNGYDSSAFFPDEASRIHARAGLGISAGEFALGTIARWHPQKDIPNFLAAARIARRRGVPVRCVLVGVGLDEANEELGKAIEGAGTASFTDRLGGRSDVQAIARALDVHVLASCGSEAFPNVVAETMLSGTPNIVTDVGDAALMVGETGWIVRPRDPEGLASAIVEAYAEWKGRPSEWHGRTVRARNRIAENFSFGRMAEAYEEVWRRSLAARAS